MTFRALLDGEHALDGIRVEGVGSQPVERVGGDGDDPTDTQAADGGGRVHWPVVAD